MTIFFCPNPQFVKNQNRKRIFYNPNQHISRNKIICNIIIYWVLCLITQSNCPLHLLLRSQIKKSNCDETMYQPYVINYNEVNDILAAVLWKQSPFKQREANVLQQRVFHWLLGGYLPLSLHPIRPRRLLPACQGCVDNMYIKAPILSLAPTCLHD